MKGPVCSVSNLLTFASMWVIFFLVSLSQYHALYLSTCEVAVHADHTWEAQLRIFFDDLEDALTNRTGERPTLSQERLPNYQHAIQTYLNEHLFFRQGTESLEFKLITCNRKEDVVELIIEGTNPWRGDGILITNDLLMEIFTAQKNVMVIKKAEDIRTLYFKKNQITEEVVF